MSTPAPKRYTRWDEHLLVQDVREVLYDRWNSVQEQKNDHLLEVGLKGHESCALCSHADSCMQAIAGILRQFGGKPRR